MTIRLVDRSGSMTISPTGRRARPQQIGNRSAELILSLYSIMNLAKNKINNILPASEGWKVRPAILIQRRAPPPDRPKRQTRISRKMQAA